MVVVALVVFVTPIVGGVSIVGGVPIVGVGLPDGFLLERNLLRRRKAIG
jgi:hypothetical protein